MSLAVLTSVSPGSMVDWNVHSSCMEAIKKLHKYGVESTNKPIMTRFFGSLINAMYSTILPYYDVCQILRSDG